MKQFRMNIDLSLLIKQIDDLAEIQETCRGEKGRGLTGLEVNRLGSLEGVITLLGEIRDQIQPTTVWNPLVVCMACGSEHLERSPCQCIGQEEPFTP